MLPLTRMQPWYPGQMGVSGSDVQRGLRWAPQGIVLYVDGNHPGASADADGTDPENPLTTITLAIARLTAFAIAMATSLEGSVIVVANEAGVTESVTIPLTAPQNCTILGASQGGIDAPSWTAATAAGTALTIQQEGWTVENFRFVAGVAGTSVQLFCTNAGVGAHRTVIRNCYFDGAWHGLYGINLVGAPYDVRVLGCEFREYTRGDTTAIAITCTSAGWAFPYMCVVQGNLFWENENHISSTANSYGFNNSIISDNIFTPGYLIAATQVLNLRLAGGGGYNTVTRNVFPGDYSNAGGYWPGTTPGFWGGNFADDLLEPEVADNGLTIAPPV